MGALPPGSYLVIADGTNTSEGFNEIQRRYEESGAVPYYLRSPEQVKRFFDGLQPVAPGILPLGQWRPDPVHSSLLLKWTRAPSAAWHGKSES